MYFFSKSKVEIRCSKHIINKCCFMSIMYKETYHRAKIRNLLCNNLYIKNYQKVTLRTIKPSVGEDSKCANTPLVRV